MNHATIPSAPADIWIDDLMLSFGCGGPVDIKPKPKRPSDALLQGEDVLLEMMAELQSEIAALRDEIDELKAQRMGGTRKLALRLAAEGKTRQEIADACGVTVGYVQKILAEEDASCGDFTPGKQVTKTLQARQRHECVKQMAADGKSREEIAEAVGLKLPTIESVLRPAGARAERDAKYREHCEAGLTRRETAEAMGMTYGGVVGAEKRLGLTFRKENEPARPTSLEEFQARARSHLRAKGPCSLLGLASAAGAGVTETAEFVGEMADVVRRGNTVWLAGGA